MTVQEPDTIQTDDMAIPGFYNRWREKTHHWISHHTRSELADAVLLLPDLLALALRLIRDSRTPLFFKSQLVLVTAYVLLPVDLIPEAVIGAAGLADDAVILSVMLLRLVEGSTQLDRQVLQENWSGNGDIVEVLRELVDNRGELVNMKVWKRVRTLFGKPDPDPAVVNGQDISSVSYSDR